MKKVMCLSKLLKESRKITENSSSALMLSVLNCLDSSMKVIKTKNNKLYKQYKSEYNRIINLYKTDSARKGALSESVGINSVQNSSSNSPSKPTQTDTCYLLLYEGDSLIKNMTLPCYPEDLSSSMSANWSDTSIVGRSSPLTSYSGTNFTETSFSFTLRREMAMHFNEPSTEGQTAEIEEIIKYLQASVYPTYISAGIKPTLATFKFGKHKIHGIIRSVSIKYDKPIISELYSQVTISVSMSEIPSKVFGVDDIVANNSHNIYNA